MWLRLYLIEIKEKDVQINVVHLFQSGYTNCVGDLLNSC